MTGTGETGFWAKSMNQIHFPYPLKVKAPLPDGGVQESPRPDSLGDRADECIVGHAGPSPRIS